MADLSQKQAIRCRLCRAGFPDQDTFARHKCPVLGALRSQRYEIVRLGSERLLVRRRRPFGPPEPPPAALPGQGRSIRRHPVLYSLLALSAVLFAVGALADRGGFGAAPAAGPASLAAAPLPPPARPAPPRLPAPDPTSLPVANPPAGLTLMDLQSLPETENGYFLILRIGAGHRLEYMMALPAPPGPEEEFPELPVALDL